MPKYVALLRGIGPGDPRMRNSKLRGVFEDLGFKNVRSVISSGNILFETKIRSIQNLESKIEKAFPEQLGFNSTTIIRSHDSLLSLNSCHPFKGVIDSLESSCNVTFLKFKPKKLPTFPYHSPKGDYYIIGIYENALCSVVNLSVSKTPDLMRWLEKEFSKQITTRTWKTVNRLLKKFDEEQKI